MELLTFQTNMARMAAAFSADVPPAKAEVYYDELRHLPDEVFAQVTKRALVEWSKPYALPPIAVLLRFAKDIALTSGARLDGAAAWEALERDVFREWSETGDRLMAQQGGAYRWPDERSRDILRNQLNLTIRDMAVMHAREYAETRARFIALYDRREAVAEAERAALPEPTALKQIGG